MLTGKAISYISTSGSVVREGRDKGTWPYSDVSLYLLLFPNNLYSLTTIKSKHGILCTFTTQGKGGFAIIDVQIAKFVSSSQKASKDD